MTFSAKMMPLARAVIGVLFIVLMAVLAGCGSNSNQTSNSTTADPTTPPEAATTTTTEPTTPPNGTEATTPIVDPVPPREELQLVVAYVRPGVQPNQHYVKVEETLAGPTPCNPDSLLVVLENTGLALQWQPEERLEIYGAYQTDDSGCRVSLDQPEHTLKTLPKPEPEIPEPEPQPQTVRLTGTVSTVRDQTAFLIVERVIDGAFECDQASILMADATTVMVDAQYDITGLYDPASANCQLRLVDPALDLHLLAAPVPVVPTPVVEPELPVSPSVPGTPESLPFFVSGGVSLVEEIPVFLGSGGFGLAENL